MRIAVLALQGAFIEHEMMLERLGAETFEIRQLSDWDQPKDGLVIPGGESTVQLKLLKDLGFPYSAHVPDLSFWQRRWKDSLSTVFPLWTSTYVAMLMVVSLAASIRRTR